jgi:acyl phosphate:glycerol-3-phosphate acyltransferase
VIELVVKAGLSYLLGSVVGSLIVGKLRGGVDIRRLGSGNAGGTNALRTQGKKFAIAVLLIDIGKGWVATRMIARWVIPGIPPASPEWEAWLPAVCGLGVMLGHVYPVWYGFRGGKGVATLLGVVLGIRPWLLLPMLLTWLVGVVLFGFVGLASMLAAFGLAISIELTELEPRLPLLTFGWLTALLILFTHRSNIARMRAGKEPRARRLWLLGARRRRA